MSYIKSSLWLLSVFIRLYVRMYYICMCVCVCVFACVGFCVICLYLYWPPSKSTSIPFSMSILNTYIYIYISINGSWAYKFPSCRDFNISNQYNDNRKGKAVESIEWQNHRTIHESILLYQIYISTLSTLTHLHVVASSCTAPDRCTTQLSGGWGRHRSTAVLGPMPSW